MVLGRPASIIWIATSFLIMRLNHLKLQKDLWASKVMIQHNSLFHLPHLPPQKSKTKEILGYIAPVFRVSQVHGPSMRKVGLALRHLCETLRPQVPVSVSPQVTL
ncbi:hypothetical protein PR048_002013 [Dryococelus australis]|uniref:Uncharacterized protein n=1 Tax=Dryococelus australis TaxID=614101 RepID=A0ABQ9IJ40_9NEOP|nr:hypothetical protein PR048_002013 [Dryococelus australis]